MLVCVSQIMIEDLAHKAAFKMGCMASDKGMNQIGQIIRCHLLQWSKSQKSLVHQDALFATRIKNLAKETPERKPIGPMFTQVSSDNPTTEEARWGGDGFGLFPHLKKAIEDIGVHRR